MPSALSKPAASDLKLWYEQPASEWIESLPVANGRLLFAGEYKKAQELVNAKVLTPHHAHGVHTYQTLGDLNLIFDHDDKILEPVDYRRELDLDRAVSSVPIRWATRYIPESFSPAQLIRSLFCA